MFSDVPIRNSLAKIFKNQSVEGCSCRQAQSSSHTHRLGRRSCAHNAEAPEACSVSHSKDLGRLKTQISPQASVFRRMLFWESSTQDILQGEPRKTYSGCGGGWGEGEGREHVWGKMNGQGSGEGVGKINIIWFCIRDIYFTRHNIKYTWIIKKTPLGHLHYEPPGCYLVLTPESLPVLTMEH